MGYQRTYRRRTLHRIEFCETHPHQMLELRYQNVPRARCALCRSVVRLRFARFLEAFEQMPIAAERIRKREQTGIWKLGKHAERLRGGRSVATRTDGTGRSV